MNQDSVGVDFKPQPHSSGSQSEQKQEPIMLRILEVAQGEVRWPWLLLELRPTESSSRAEERL